MCTGSEQHAGHAMYRADEEHTRADERLQAVLSTLRIDAFGVEVFAVLAARVLPRAPDFAGATVGAGLLYALVLFGLSALLLALC